MAETGMSFVEARLVPSQVSYLNNTQLPYSLTSGQNVIMARWAAFSFWRMQPMRDEIGWLLTNDRGEKL
jgi:hypothetical protein